MRAVLSFLLIILSILRVSSFESYDMCNRTVVRNHPFYKCSYLGWKQLPSELPDDLVYLAVDNNLITSLPPDSLNSKKVVGLIINNNNILSVDGAFSNLPNLQMLYMNNNSIDYLPHDVFSHNLRLSVIELRYNNIKVIPQNIFLKLKYLRLLRLGNNSITVLPNNLFKENTILSGLDLSFNRINAIENNVFAGVNRLNEINLAHNQIAKLPPNFAVQMKSARRMDLSHNQLTDFPFTDFIYKTKKLLIDLDLNTNAIVTIPELFAKQSMIRSFNFGNNPFWCDCKLDWMRRKHWYRHTNKRFEEELDIKEAFFTQSVSDAKATKCAGPELYKDGFPGHFLTLCDVDECEAEFPCAAGSMTTCKNLPGDYECTCNSGYWGDGKYQCTDHDECMSVGLLTMECNTLTSICINTIGSYTCQCLAGYHDADTKKYNCQDTDECKTGRAMCPESATCINTKGSYKCTCPTGHNIVNFKCVDIDECSSENHGCEKKCYNTIGSYVCNCPVGFYYADDGECYDKNECQVENVCHQYATCANSVGSFTCRCMKGFIGDGKKCTDMDECLYWMHNCHENATCMNSLGSYTCKCKDNLHGDGRTFCGSRKGLNQKFVENLSGQKSVILKGKENGGSEVVIILVVLIVLILGVAVALFIIRPKFLFKPKDKIYGEVKRPMTDDVTIPLRSDE